ncbi:MAG: metallophosphoesterase [Methylobacteriaceae bacterium]|nr:metallophosphoesterase [Methylobacteriaceae bacterium]
MTTWFTADTHFTHARIIDLAKRPFPNAAAMDEAMIAAWNTRVQPDDTVWHLGDFAFGRDERIEAVFHRLTGIKHLVIGNHDEGKEALLTLPWASISQIATTIVDGQRIAMCHYPMMSWPQATKGAIHLFGHMHGRLRGTRHSIDVGVDCWGFQPVTLTNIRRRLATLPLDPDLDATPGHRRP